MAISCARAQNGREFVIEGASMATLRAAFAAAILLAVSACGDPASTNGSRQASATRPSASPSPDAAETFVKAHAPKAEMRLINSAEQFSTRQDATGAAAVTDIDNRKAESWREAVRGAVNFTGWVAYVDSSEPTGRIYLKVTGDMFLWADIPVNAPFYATFRNLSRYQVVNISGSIANDDTAGLKGDVDRKSPTCFEAASGPQGCHVELTDLRPLASPG
jgi:hypothetical protein